MGEVLVAQVAMGQVADVEVVHLQILAAVISITTPEERELLDKDIMVPPPVRVELKSVVVVEVQEVLLLGIQGDLDTRLVYLGPHIHIPQAVVQPLVRLEERQQLTEVVVSVVVTLVMAIQVQMDSKELLLFGSLESTYGGFHPPHIVIHLPGQTPSDSSHPQFQNKIDEEGP
jgi:hypothetical protein